MLFQKSPSIGKVTNDPMSLSSLSSGSRLNVRRRLHGLHDELFWQIRNTPQIKSIKQLIWKDDLTQLDLSINTFKDPRTASDSQVSVFISQISSLD